MKRKEITVQSLMVERITFRRRRKATAMPTTCEVCRRPANWLRLPDLLEQFDMGLEALFAAFESGNLHIFLGPRGTLYVCASSAARRFGQVAE